MSYEKTICNNNIYNKVIDFIKQNNLDIIYLTRFGSHLYGTENLDSDTDIKGIFLPRKRDLFLNRVPNCFTKKTNNTNEHNTSIDIDIELYSLHNFLHMTERGDTGALDLLFSYTNQNALIYYDTRWQHILNNKEYLFNPTNTRAFVGYAIRTS